MAFKKIIKNLDYLVLTASTVICALFQFVYSVYAKKYVVPSEFGIYSTCLLLQVYLNYAQFGVLNSYNRDYPQLLGMGNKEDIIKLRNTTFSFILIVYVLLAVIVDIIILFIYKGSVLSNHYGFGYLMVPIIVLLDTVTSYEMYTCRMNGRYNYSALVNLIKTVISIGLGLLAVKFLNYYGLYVITIIASIVSIVFYWKDGFKGLKLCIDKKILKNSILTGLPLLINSLIWTVMQSVDKFVILIFLTTEDLGVYTVPLLGFNALVLVPQTISQVFYYKVSELYGATKNKILLIDKCNYFTELTAACTGLVSILAFYILPIFVQQFMPNYIAGVKPAQILIIGVAIYSSSMLYGNIFSALKMNKELLINSVVLCIFNIIFSVLFVLINGRNIANVALGTSLSYFLYSGLLIIILSYKFKYSIKKLAKSCWLEVFKSIIPCLLFYVLIKNTYIAMGLSLVVSIGLYIPLVIREIKKNSENNTTI
jgi:O-antigen/teichoic acid export membrane protein